MPNLKGITIDLGLSDKSVLKLRAIAKHAEALADELDAIDNAWQCDCGSFDYQDQILLPDNNIGIHAPTRVCLACNERYLVSDKVVSDG